MLPLLASSGTAMCAYSTITASPTYPGASSQKKTGLMTAVVTSSNGREVEYLYTKYATTELIAGQTMTVTVAEPVSTSTLLPSKDPKGVHQSTASGKMASRVDWPVLATLAVGVGLVFLLIA